MNDTASNKKGRSTLNIPAARTTQDAASLLGRIAPDTAEKVKKPNMQVLMEPPIKQRVHALAIKRGKSLKALMEEIVTEYLDSPKGEGAQ